LQPWAAGDVIGVLLDLEKGEVQFARNGVSMGVGPTAVRRHLPGLAYFPAVSLSLGERCEPNFGGRPFAYPVDGFQALSDAPPAATSAAARFCLSCLRRLVVAVAAGAGAGTAAPPDLDVDTQVLLAASLVQHLGPLLRLEHVVVDAFVPFLSEVSAAVSAHPPA
jgi:SPRY domain